MTYKPHRRRIAKSYIRTSIGHHAHDEVSRNEQRRANESEADKRGYRIDSEYIDSATAGRSQHRPEFERMIADCCRNCSSVEVVFICGSSRISRDPFELERYRRKLQTAGVVLLSSA